MSLSRRVLDGPPQRWLYHPCWSWLVPVRQCDSQSLPRGDGGPLLPSTWLTEHELCFSKPLTRLSVLQNSLFNSLGQPLLSLIYSIYLPAMTPHACSQDNTHDRRPSFGHCWILRIQRASPTLPRHGSFRDVIYNELSGPRIPPL